jgi:RimJ/RimL family protein N-acetyltransferase
MKLLPLDSRELIALAGGWLSAPENARWLDFGNGIQVVTPVMLTIMTQRDIHCLRVYTGDDGETPAGVVGLSNIDRHFKTASVWCVLGDKSQRGCSPRAVSKMLTIAFAELGLEAVNCWTLEINKGGRGVIDRLPFKFIGRLRQCHYIDGTAYDRLLYDMLASEHWEI